LAKKAATKKTAKKQASNKGATARATTSTAAKTQAARPASKTSPARNGAAKSAPPKPAKKAAKKTAKKPAAPARAAGTASTAKNGSKAKSAPAPKPAAKPAAKPRSAKPKPAAKSSTKPASAAKSVPTTKPAEAATPAPATPAPTAPAATEKPADAKSGRKGITIVNKKTTKKVSRPKTPTQLPRTEPLLGDGAFRKPLIPSGPSASSNGTNGAADATAAPRSRSAFTEKQLQEFRDRLLIKRAELLGDISTMEAEALLSNSGNLSRSPSHIGDYGSDSFEQTLTLNLAAADRRLLREIDDALQRIADGVFGTCELSGKPIGLARLRELPWTRYSIEAARELESRAN